MMSDSEKKLVTGLWWMGVLETVGHALIDFGKGEGLYGPCFEQGCHVACKVAWFIICSALGVGLFIGV
jgi:hypothetical protein